METHGLANKVKNAITNNSRTQTALDNKREYSK